MTLDNTLSPMFSSGAAVLWDGLYGAFADKETEFVCSLGAREGRTGNALDIGCGTGRFLIPLVQKGWQVTGIDTSVDMLAVLKQKAAKRGVEPSVFPVEFSRFETGEQYDLILSFYSMIYLRSDRSLESFFAKAMALLRPRGVFLVNFFNLYEFWHPDGWVADMGRIFKTGHLKVNYVNAPFDMVRGVAKVSDFRRLSHQGRLTSDLSFRPIRYHAPSTVRSYLKMAGFKGIRMYPGFENRVLETSDARAPVVTLAARK